MLVLWVYRCDPGKLGKVIALSQENSKSATPPNPVRDRRFSVMVVSGVLSVVLGVAAMTIPVPYVIESPGPAINTIGEMNGKPIITFTGHESFPASSGSLDLTTVRVSGGLPDSQINFFDAMQAWLTPAHTLYPAELLYAPGISQEAVNNENSAAMAGSQQNATAAALNALDIGFESSLAVNSVPGDGAAAGILKPDDVLLTINDKNVTDLKVIQDVLAQGKGAPVKVVIRRGETETPLSVTPKLGDAGKYLLGIALQNKFTFPFDVKISLENIGGPSAGMIFALGIMDNLTPGELTGGKQFAGTGTIDSKGDVGAIGGIAQKMVGARTSGADYFLAPSANCEDVVGHIPKGLQVIKVSTLKEAYDAVSVIGSGQDGSALPTCK